MRVQRLSITKPGVYENILVDGEWADGTLVKITADGVTLRNCEIRNGTHNAVTVYARDVVIESCKIHHALSGTYAEQHDAHGITGRPTNLTIRNCDIGLTSGDAIQFDPGRAPGITCSSRAARCGRHRCRRTRPDSRRARGPARMPSTPSKGSRTRAAG